MGLNPKELSQVQQNECRAALNKFIDRHELSDWEMTVTIEEPDPGQYSLTVDLRPPSEPGLSPWPLKEVVLGDASFNVAAAVDEMLELCYEAHVARQKALNEQPAHL
jgi:hypothetical protein